MKFIVLVAVLVGWSTPAFAWDGRGHMMVAAIAWKHLTPAVQARATALLKLNPYYARWTADAPADLVDEVAFVRAATWPDAIKNDQTYTMDGERPSGPTSAQNIGYADMLQHRYWHFIDTPFSTDGTPLVQPVAPNAQTQIAATATIASPDASDGLKSYDLTWLLHLVGDVHQPLHATSRSSAAFPSGDVGGNDVNCTPCGPYHEVHAFWDDALGTNNKSATAAMSAANRLPDPPADQAAISDDRVWISESFAIAQQYAYAPPVGTGAGPYTLDQNYQDNARQQAELRVELAGVRLANLINANLR